MTTDRFKCRLLALAAGFFFVTLPAIAPASALGDGPCGQDYTGGTACAVNGADSSYGGQLVADNDIDFYVFHASANTHLTFTITDEEDPTCSTNGPNTCGSVSAAMFDYQGSQITGGYSSSQPNSGITVPQTWSYIIGSAGTYYLQVSGFLTRDSNNNPVDLPYSLNVQASPAVQWPWSPPPPPPPPCVVPHAHRVRLATVEQRLVDDHCTVGTIRRVHSKHVAKGDVIKLSAFPGQDLANGAAVNITVSRGHRHR